MDRSCLVEVGRRFHLDFRVRLIPLLGVVVLGVLPSAFVLNQPALFRELYVIAFGIVSLGSVPYITNLVAMPVGQLVCLALCRKRYRTEVYSGPNVEQLVRKMDVHGRVKVLVTDNPAVKGMSCSLLSGKVYVSKEWTERLPEAEILGGLSHEFGHYRKRRVSCLESLMASAGAVAMALILSLFLQPSICQMVLLTSDLMAITCISWRNEYRADAEGAILGGSEGLIALLEQLSSCVKRDEGSETHPPLGSRIRRLSKLQDPSDPEEAIHPRLNHLHVH